MTEAKPTDEFYSLFQFINEFLNDNLFDGQLPNSMIVVTRKKKTFGYFIPSRWQNKEAIRSDEIAINPSYFEQFPLVELLQTITHEMCHQWQYHFGKRKKARAYHDKEWSNKMVEIGLMPSNTGRPGGKKTGIAMMDYPIANGRFVIVANSLIKEKQFENLWFDRFVTYDKSFDIDKTNTYQDLGLDEQLIIPKKPIGQLIIPEVDKKVKVTYKCQDCDVKVWGKPSLSIRCDCKNNGKPFKANL